MSPKKVLDLGCSSASIRFNDCGNSQLEAATSINTHSKSKTSTVKVCGNFRPYKTTQYNTHKNYVYFSNVQSVLNNYPDEKNEIPISFKTVPLVILIYSSEFFMNRSTSIISDMSADHGRRCLSSLERGNTPKRGCSATDVVARVLFVFYSISTFEGYLEPNPFLYKWTVLF